MQWEHQFFFLIWIDCTGLCVSILSCVCPCSFVCVYAHLCVSTLICACPYSVVCVHAQLCVSTLSCVCPRSVVCVHTHLCVSMLSCVCPFSIVCFHAHLCVSTLSCVFYFFGFMLILENMQCVKKIVIVYYKQAWEIGGYLGTSYYLL